MKSQITGLRASTDNKASTVLALFLDAVTKYGTPSRCRGDRGGENVEVCVWMIMRRGANRASFMWGSCVNFHDLDHHKTDVGCVDQLGILESSGYG